MINKKIKNYSDNELRKNIKLLGEWVNLNKQPIKNYSDLNAEQKRLFDLFFEKYVYSDLKKQDFKNVLELVRMKIDGEIE